MWVLVLGWYGFLARLCCRNVSAAVSNAHVLLTRSGFLRRRSLAQGIASSGSGTIGVIYAVATTPMIERLSLGWALRITGSTSCAVLLVATALLRDRNKDTKAEVKPLDRTLLRQTNVLLLCGYTICVTMGYMTVIYSFSAFTVGLGYSQTQGGNITAILNVGTALGRPLIGKSELVVVQNEFSCTGTNLVL